MHFISVLALDINLPITYAPWTTVLSLLIAVGVVGWGLQIVRSMLAAHGGAIQLLPSDAGAVFEIRVPLAAL